MTAAPAATDALWSYMSNARWFSGKGRGGELVGVIALDWLSAPGAAAIAVRPEIATVAYPDGSTEHYQLLTAYRATDQGPGLIGPADPQSGSGLTFAFDAARDPQAMALVLPALAANTSTNTWQATVNDGFGGDLSPRVFNGEQSNTNVLLGNTALLKVFRKLEPGHNLDIEVHDALGRAGVRSVAKLYGWVSSTVTPVGGTTTLFDLMMIAELLPGVEDGWALAVESCREGTDFTEHSARLGASLRAVHDALVDTFPTKKLVGDDVVRVMTERLDAAEAIAPSLTPHRSELEKLFAKLSSQSLRGQRIHGDFHLGQTLHLTGASGDGSWRIIDFEGEPMKQMWERVLPDSPWRDVAGMMRSLSYATSGHDDPQGAAAQQWLAENRRAFLSAYSGKLTPADAVTLAAYEADKAVYEVVYETRNRPDWLPIPLSGLERLIADSTP